MGYLLLLSAVIAGFAISVTSLAQQRPPEENDPFVALHRQKQNEAATEIKFTIRLKDNQTRFQQGETIGLELIFSSSEPSRFTLNMASYEFGGRLALDDFILDRERSAVDALSDYYNSLSGLIGGGSGGFRQLEDKPVMVIAELNEWRRIDQPGNYRLYLVSKRVSKKADREDVYPGYPPLSLVSNIIEFEIVPTDEKWAKQKFAEAVAAIEQSNDQKRRAGCRVLRFLGTREAAREMVKRLGAGDVRCNSEFSFGLVGSPYRRLIISEMEQSLAAPNFPVTTTFLRTLAIVVFAAEESGFPPYPQGDEAAIKRWQTALADRRKSYNAIQRRYLYSLASAISGKGLDAQAVSLQTLLDYRDLAKSDDATATHVDDLLSIIPGVFLRLPVQSQTWLLKAHWKTLAAPAMLPVLQKIYDEPAPVEGPDFNRQRELRSIALTRLYELAPEQGRRLILEEITRPDPTVHWSALDLLPDEILPEFDNLLATHLEQTRESDKGKLETISALIERYATAAILPRVQAFFSYAGVERWACRTQSSLLAYILRVDPPTGGELFVKALAIRGSDSKRCYAFVLTEVADLHMSPKVEAAAIEALEDDEPEMVVRAAHVLRQHGTARAEERLWDRFERWNRETRDRAGELKDLSPGIPALGASDLRSQVDIEQALVGALSRGQGWLADKEKLERLRTLCHSQYSLKILDAIARSLSRKISIGINQFADKPYMIRLAQYEFASISALKNKLLQFPPGTVFRFSSDQNPRSQQLFKEIKSYLEAQGMGLEEP